MINDMIVSWDKNRKIIEQIGEKEETDDDIFLFTNGMKVCRGKEGVGWHMCVWVMRDRMKLK